MRKSIKCASKNSLTTGEPRGSASTDAGVELNRARRGSGEDLVDLSELPGERFLRLLQVNRR